MIFNDYIVLKNEANNYFWQEDADENKVKEYTNKLKALRDSFTKSDWEELIAQSHGRAKYEYTRMMKEKFPD